MPQTERPNIILLVGEDTGRWYGCYGDDQAKTPNVDRIAAEGCKYTNAYSTAPVCAPSRSTMVSGHYAMKLGSHHMRSKLVNPPRTLTQELRDAGYYVNWHTKLDFNFEPQDGWRDSDESWVEQLAAGDLPDKPWFFYTNIGITHESSMWPTEDPEAIAAGDPAYAPGHRGTPQCSDPAAVRVPAYLPDTPEVRADIARHYDSLADLDRQVGEVLDALEKSGQAENTYVFYISDHGRGLPREKRWTYTNGIQLPLLVKGPGIEPGSVNDDMTSWVDLAPTLLSLAGATIPQDYDGQAFLGDAAAAQPREVIFAGRDRMDENYDRVRAARDKQYHYIRNYYPQMPWAQRLSYMEKIPTMQVLRKKHAAGELAGKPEGAFMAYPKPSEELYDVAADPDCVNNLADDPAHAAGKQRLAAAMDAWLSGFTDLAELSERELIQRGIVENVLDDDYAKRIEPFPNPAYQVGGITSILEQDEAETVQLPA